MPDLHSPLEWLRWFARNAKRLLVFVVGVSILLAGIAMLALPGPGVVVIIVGLVVLATEFTLAERALDKTTSTAAGAATKVQDSRTGRWSLVASGVGLVAAGLVVAILFSNFVVVGITTILAGVIGLATLLPPVQRWIADKAQEPTHEPI